MSITDRKAFIDVLKDVSPALSKPEQEAVYVFTPGSVEAFNKEIAIRRDINVQGLDLEGRVLAEGMFSALNKMSSEKVSIDKRGNEIILAAGRIKVGIPVIEGDYAAVKTDGLEWVDMPKGLLEAIGKCMASVGPETGPPSESSIMVSLMDGKALSCDGYRATRHEFEKLPDAGAFLLPGKVVKVIQEFNPTKIAIPKDIGIGSNAWCHFQNDVAILSVVFFADDGTDWKTIEGLFDFKSLGEVQFPDTLPETAQRAVIFAKEEVSGDDHVEILISNGTIKFSSSGIRGWIEEEVDVDYKGEELSFALAASFLGDLVGLDNRTALIGEDRLTFHGEGWQHVVSRFVL